MDASMWLTKNLSESRYETLYCNLKSSTSIFHTKPGYLLNIRLCAPCVYTACIRVLFYAKIILRKKHLYCVFIGREPSFPNQITSPPLPLRLKG